MSDIGPRRAELGLVGNTPEQAQACELLRDERHVFAGYVNAAVDARAKSRHLVGETPSKFDCRRHRPLPGEFRPTTAGRREVGVRTERDHDWAEIDLVVQIDLVKG